MEPRTNLLIEVTEADLRYYHSNRSVLLPLYLSARRCYPSHSQIFFTELGEALVITETHVHRYPYPQKLRVFLDHLKHGHPAHPDCFELILKESVPRDAAGKLIIPSKEHK